MATKEKSVVDKIRKPVAPPTKAHADKNKYTRKTKHKAEVEVDEGCGAKKKKNEAQSMSQAMDKALSKQKPISAAQKKKNQERSAALDKKKKEKVSESVERPMKFKDMIKLVIESGGQQQIDPVDEALFDWAMRVATVKENNTQKQEIYAGLLYERYGGKFNLHDVLSEDK